MQTTLDEMIATVLGAREDGPDALAAVAMAFGSSMVLGTLGNTSLKATIAELRAAQTAADEMRDALRHERDAARAERQAARDSATEARADAARLREALDACREERDRCGALIVAAREERDRAVRERDEARAHPTYEARTVAPTPEECAAHEADGGVWYITGGTTLSCVVSSTAADAPPWAAHWVPINRDGLPCAWPVTP